MTLFNAVEHPGRVAHASGVGCPAALLIALGVVNVYG